MNDPIIYCKNLNKTYHDGTSDIQVLKSVQLSIQKGDRIAILGVSGSGKSTLLHLLGGLDNPTTGEVGLLGQAWGSMSEKKRCQLRNQQLGFVYQFHHLLPEFTAVENVALPLLLGNMSSKLAKAKAESLLTKVGLSQRLQHTPSQLSGGERQRVAIARALVNNPGCILADEPTGNLDQGSANQVFDLMLALNKEFNTALVMVTHDQKLAASMDRVFTIENGLLMEQ